MRKRDVGKRIVTFSEAGVEANADVRLKKPIVALIGLAVITLAGCAAPTAKQNAVSDQIDAELNKAVQGKVQAAQPDVVTRALMPSIQIALPNAHGKQIESRFDLVINNAPANQVFMGIVSGTRYSMLVHPDVSGTISVNLKDVNVFEALDAIREMYGYDYKVDGTRIYIQPLTLQTKVFKVNYLSGLRKGTSEIRVTSGSIGSSGSSAAATSPSGTTTTGAPTTQAIEGSTISTTSSNDFWAELDAALKSIVGAEGGRSVVISPQAGVIVVRGMPTDLRNVDGYLKASQLSVDRQVILEAKIIEVKLKDGYQTGVNWATFDQFSRHRFSAGANTNNLQLPGGTLPPGAVTATTLSGTLPDGTTFDGTLPDGTILSTSSFGNVLGAGAATAGGATAAGLFGLAFQTGSFAALINFLETQGAVQVLSSPRIATLNNQKAVLKVGTDEFFVTNVSSTTTTGTATTTTPTVTLQPFFSGIALDVTPQIDGEGNITLHIHPSVSQVSTVEKTLNLGGNNVLKLPLASSTISETDSIVRTQDGQIVAIGGLMRQATSDGKNQVPGVGDVPVVGSLFKNTNQAIEKSELVILLKSTVIQNADSWSQDILDSQNRIRGLQKERR